LILNIGPLLGGGIDLLAGVELAEKKLEGK
jgi:hypothetical protein